MPDTPMRMGMTRRKPGQRWPGFCLLACLSCGVQAQVQGSGEFEAMLIDDKAVLTDQDRKYVYVLGPENKAIRKDVELGRMIDGLRVVESGLATEDKVIVRGVQKVFMPGMPVTPQTIAMGAPAPSPARPVAVK